MKHIQMLCNRSCCCVNTHSQQNDSELERINNILKITLFCRDLIIILWRCQNTEDLIKRSLFYSNPPTVFVFHRVCYKLEFEPRCIHTSIDLLHITGFSAELMTGRVLWQRSDKSLSSSSLLLYVCLFPKLSK